MAVEKHQHVAAGLNGRHPSSDSSFSDAASKVRGPRDMRREELAHIERLDLLRNEKFNPDQDIATGPDGIWEWATDKPALHAAVRNYFDERQEDG
jgi:hypothetical protein